MTSLVFLLQGTNCSKPEAVAAGFLPFDSRVNAFPGESSSRLRATYVSVQPQYLCGSQAVV